MQPNAPTLWCCHVHGPDDVIACDDKAHAERLAAKVNEYVGKHLDAADSDAPVITAMAAPWPWAAEAHTRNLEVPSKDYAGWFGATRPLPKADEDALRAHLAELETLINTPELQDFAKAVPLEAAHQRSRWGTDHDTGKAPADWFWLVGYLAGKALTSCLTGNVDKAKHHVITTAAALANWHAALTGADTSMRPGIEPPAADVETA